MPAKSLQSCPTLCDPIDGSPPGSPILGILQARTPEWVAISFSNAGNWKVKVKVLSRVRLFATPWTAAHQAPPSMGFSRQEDWSGMPLPSPGLWSMRSQRVRHDWGHTHAHLRKGCGKLDMGAKWFLSMKVTESFLTLHSVVFIFQIIVCMKIKLVRWTLLKYKSVNYSHAYRWTPVFS